MYILSLYYTSTRVYLEITLVPATATRQGILSISSILPQILPQTSSQTQGKQRVSRMEHPTPSVFPGNFRKRKKTKVLGTLCFPFVLFPENLAEPKFQKPAAGSIEPPTSYDRRDGQGAEGWPVYRLPVDRVDGRPFGRRVYRSLPVDRDEPTTAVYR